MELIQEFNVGDLVTFAPYDRKVPAKVIGVRIGSLFDPDDGRVFYELVGAGNEPLLSTTTGNSIIQSRYYRLLQREAS